MIPSLDVSAHDEWILVPTSNLIWMAWAGVLALACTAPARAADFFAGKTITISTYGAPGDSYDVYMRLLSRHYGRHIPGNPRFTPVNQTGAGGLVAINHAGMVAPQDGTFITVASQGLLIFEATGQKGLQTSISNFNWLGSFTQSNNVTVTWRRAILHARWSRNSCRRRSRSRARWRRRPACQRNAWSFCAAPSTRR